MPARLAHFRFHFLFFALQLSCLVAYAAPAEQLNLLIITVDDMNCDSMGTFGCKLADTTPNMDALAKSGMRFQYAHVQVGNCMPSRNVMWSGRYPHNNGVEGFYQVQDARHPMLCDLAKDAGYFTAIRHKIGHSSPYNPYHWDLELDDLPNGKKAHTKDAASYGHSTQRGIEAAQKAGKPFCLWINISDPHKPFYTQVRNGIDPHVPTKVFTSEQVPVPGFLPDDKIVREELALYYSSVRRADDAVGRILDALQESGKADNTVILFLSDHGMPLPFAKTQLYHHSTHTPLSVVWPKVTVANTLDDEHMVSAVDFVPTLSEILGLKTPSNLDGRSFAPILRGENQTGRDFVIKEYNENSGGKRNPMRAIETKDFLYIFNPWSNGTRPMATATNGTLTYKRMKQLAANDSSVAARVELMDHRTVEELYKVSDDPDCLHNLIENSDYTHVADELRRELLASMKTSHDPIAGILPLRDDPQALEDYMQRVQAESDQRRANKRKTPKNASAKTNSRQNAGNRKTARKGKASLFKIESAAIDEKKLTVAISHKLGENLGTRKLTVTLKNDKLKRIDRKEMQISGRGAVKITFETTDKVRLADCSVAAFLGEAYANNLQHSQETVASLQAE